MVVSFLSSLVSLRSHQMFDGLAITRILMYSGEGSSMTWHYDNAGKKYVEKSGGKILVKVHSRFKRQGDGVGES